MMLGAALSAIPGGYDQGAVGYWKRKELEDQQAALRILGSYAMDGNIPGSMPGGGGAGSAPPPGPAPSMPSPSIAPTMAGGGPTMMAGGPQPGAPMPLNPAVMGQNPPQGFARPPVINGQPQNMFTGPQIPPGGFNAGPPGQPMAAPPGAAGPPMMGGAPNPAAAAGPANPAMPAPPRPPQPPPLPPGTPQLVQKLGNPPPGGYDWRQVARELSAANPNADPATIGRALLMLQPLLSQQSRIETQLLNQMLREQQLLNAQGRMQMDRERLDERTREFDEREGRMRDNAGERRREFDTREQRQGTQFDTREQRLGRNSDERRREFDEREGRLGRAGETRARQADERLGIQREAQQTRKQRYEDMLKQSNKRLDLQSQKLLQDKEAAMERSANRARALDQSADQATRKQAFQDWKSAMDNYHRTVRERIGAAVGISDAKQRKAWDERLGLMEENDRAEMAAAEQNYRAGGRPGAGAGARPGTEPPGGTPPAATPPAAAPGSPAARSQGMGALGQRLQQLKPIPADKMDAVKKLMEQHGRDTVIMQLQEQGWDTRGL